MDIKEILRTLCEASGVSGNEFSVSEKAAELLKKYTDEVSVDSFGNVVAFIGNRDNGKKTVLLDAHLDEIGLIVTFIDEKGFIKVSNCGGVDTRLLLAQTVTIHGREKIKGIVSTLPPHVATDSSKAAKLEDIAIDTGYSKEELEKIVSLGDRITVDSAFGELLGSKLTSKAIDDRSGVASLIYAADLASKGECAYNIAVCLAVQEETGSAGAIINSYNINPDFAIAVDVSYGKSPSVEDHECGKLGKGTMIGFAPVLDKELTARLVALSEKEKLPYQQEIMGGRTGTDADDICISRGGVRTALLSIPQRYMHTPVEVIDIDDVKTTGALIAAFLREGM